MGKYIEKVQRLDKNTIRVSLTGNNEVVIPTLVPLPMYGVVRVRLTQVFYGDALVADLAPYLNGGESC